MKKRIKMVHENNWEASVEVDIEVAMPFIEHMVKFWSEWEDKLEEHNGDLLKCFSELLAIHLYSLAARGQRVYHLQNEPEEGWAPLTPEYGFHNLDIEQFEVEAFEFTIEVADVKEGGAGK